MASAYFQPYLINVWPNIIFLTAIFFALATLTRKMLPVYVASVILLIGYFTFQQTNSTTLTASVRAALSDPLGSAAIDAITRYWSPYQRNTQLIPLQGILLANRALWLGVGALFLGFAYVKFQFAYPAEKAKRRKVVEEKEAVPTRESLPVAHPTFSITASFQHLVCSRSFSSKRRPRTSSSSY